MIRNFRCCMCPNKQNPQSRRCPPGPFKGQEATCDFVVAYMDDKQAVIEVVPGLPNDGTVWMTGRFARVDKPPVRITTKRLPIRENFDEAQADLNAYAREKGWMTL